MRLEVTAHAAPGLGGYFEYVNAYADWDGDGKFGSGTKQECPEVSGEPLTRPEVQTGREQEHVMSRAMSRQLADADGNMTFTEEFAIHRHENVGHTYVRVSLSDYANACNPCDEPWSWGDVWDVRTSFGDRYPRTGGTHHSADYNPADFRISLSELLRVIQIYNLGAYYCDDSKEDGYAPGPGDDDSCTAHDSDYSPQDWKISLSELLRLQQFYNLGGYHSKPGGEDGFSPGKEASDGNGDGNGDTVSVSLERMYADDARSEDDKEDGEDREDENRIRVNKATGDLIEIVHEISNSENTGNAIVDIVVSVPGDWEFKKWYIRDDSKGTNCTDHTPADTDKITGGKFTVPADIPAGKTVQAGIRFKIRSEGTVSSEILSKSGAVLASAKLENSISMTGKVKAVIVTNRDNLYEIYGDSATELLRTLFVISDSRERSDGKVKSVIYYADWYDDSIRNWDNQDCMSLYCSEVKCRRLRSLGISEKDYLWPKNWTPAVLYMGYYFSDVFHYTDYNELTGYRVQASSDESDAEEFSYYAIADSDNDPVKVSCGRIVGASAADMLSLIRRGLTGPQGDDNIVIASTSDGVVKHMDELLPPLFGTFGSGIRVNGLSSDDDLLGNYISTCLENSYYGQPCYWNNDGAAKWLIESGTWGCSDFVGAINGQNPKYVLEGSHTYPLYFEVLKENDKLIRPCAVKADSRTCAYHPEISCSSQSDCPGSDEKCVADSWTWADKAFHVCTTHDLDSDLNSGGRFVAMLGCHAAAIEERSDSHTSSLAYEFIHKGACGYFGSTVLVYADSRGIDYPVFGAKLYNMFVGNLANSDMTIADPNTITVGNAFRKALNEYRETDQAKWDKATDRPGRVSNTYKHHRTPTQFQLYGIPWMNTNLPYPSDSSGEKREKAFFKSRKGYTFREDRPESEESRVTVRSEVRSGGTFSKMLTFNVTDYNITRQDSFDLVEIPGAETDITDYLPVLPFLMATLNLPKDASVISVRLTGGTTESLGRLNIPTYLLIPGPDAPPSFTDVTYVTGLFPEPNCSHGVFHYDDYTKVIIYFAPVQHNVDTRETTLWTGATVEVKYEVDECIYISDLRTDRTSYKSSEPVITTVTVNNVGDTDVTGLTAVGAIEDYSDNRFRETRVSVGTVPAGGSTEVTVSIENGLTNDSYITVVEIRDENDSLITSLEKMDPRITSDEISDFTIPGEITLFEAGDEIPFRLVYQNYSPHPLEGLLTVKVSGNSERREIFTDTLTIPGESSEEITVYGDTQCLKPGEYRAWAVFEPDGRREQYSDDVFFTMTPGDLNCDFDSDTDGDGWPDGLESGLGSDPSDRESYPASATLLVTDGSGNPVPGAEVWLKVGSGKLFQGETDSDGRAEILAGEGIVVEAYWQGRKASAEIRETKPEYSLILPLLPDNDPPGIVVQVMPADLHAEHISVTVSGDPLTSEPEVILSQFHSHGVPMTSPDGGPWSGTVRNGDDTGVLELSASSASGTGRSVTSFSIFSARTALSEYSFRDGGADLFGSFSGSGKFVISETSVPAPANSGLVQVGNILSLGIPKIAGPVGNLFLIARLSALRSAGTDITQTDIYGWDAGNGTWHPAGGDVVYPDQFDAILRPPHYESYALFAPPSGDTLPPDPVTDLRAETGTWPGGIMLRWTGPEDNEGVYVYDIRHSRLPITESDWDGCASHLRGSDGTAESSGLEMPGPGRDYYFAIRAGDAAGNWSEVTFLNTPTKAYMYDDDGDGMCDTWEWENYLDLTTDDSQNDGDGDGLTNREEFGYDTNPRASDTDGDGHPDSEEVSLGTDPLDPDSYPRPPGDLDCDSAVTLADALIALRLAASENTPPRFCLSDADGDGRIGLADAVFILQKIVVPE